MPRLLLTPALAAAVLLSLASALWSPANADPAPSAASPAQAASTLAPMPHFRFDTTWLKLPANLYVSEITAVAVDRHDHLWVLHRPRTVKDHDASQVAPPIMEFDAAGRYLRGFGGPGAGYQWPDVEHSLAVSTNGDVWVSGNSRTEGHGDDMLLVFDRQGRFVRQIGKRSASRGNFDTANFHAPADIFIDDRAHEVYVADGYGNQRVVVLDERDGRFLRMWGAFGLAPPQLSAPAQPQSQPPQPQTQPQAVDNGEGARSFNGVHAVEKSRDGRLYVSDRLNQRIQVFTPQGKYLGQVSIDRGLDSPITASGIAFSRDPGQTYMYVADWGNGRIVVVDRHRLQVIGVIGHSGDAPGEFHGPHLIDVDSHGVLYVAEVQGHRVQRLVPEP